jgi:hypothetical protein
MYELILQKKRPCQYYLKGAFMLYIRCEDQT